MATQTWPVGSIPNEVIFNTYQESVEAFVSEFQPDVGPPNRWPRSAVGMLAASWSIWLTGAQRAALLTFYSSTCKGGALPFTLDDPITATNYTWYWINSPSFVSTVGEDQFSVEIALRRFLT